MTVNLLVHSSWFQSTIIDVSDWQEIAKIKLKSTMCKYDLRWWTPATLFCAIVILKYIFVVLFTFEKCSSQHTLLLIAYKGIKSA